MPHATSTVFTPAAQHLQLKGEDTLDDVVRPDIEWIPSHDTHKNRVRRLAALDLNRPNHVPEDWPTTINGPRSWTGSEFADSSKYVVQFSLENVAEIESALIHFKSLSISPDPEKINKETFPLPTLNSVLDCVSKEIHDGKGFAVLRGLDPKKYSTLDNVLLYVGITSHIAEIRGCQDYDGRMIVHIQDIKHDVRDYAERGPFSPYTARAQPFHTDRCDVLSMYACDIAPSGGESLLASNAMIYNEIAKTRPDILHVLADDKWIFDEFHNGDYHTRPLMHNFPSHGPGFVYSRRPLTGAWFSPHMPVVPAMTEFQAEALDTVHFVAEKHHLGVQLQRGDIEIVNNFALFHARRSFVDDISSRRHLMRLWLRSEKYSWEAPEIVANSSAEIYDPESTFRSKPIWDIFTSPPLGRGTYRRMDCN